jgi:hypothetical protein
MQHKNDIGWINDQSRDRVLKLTPAVPGNPDSPALVWVLYVDSVKNLPKSSYNIGVFTDREELDRYMKALPNDPKWGKRIGNLRVEEHQLNVGLFSLSPQEPPSEEIVSCKDGSCGREDCPICKPDTVRGWGEDEI